LTYPPVAPSREDVLAILQRSVVVVLGDEAPTVSMDAHLGPEGLGIDSLDLIEISMILEDELGITLEPTQLEGIESVTQLIDVVRSGIPAATDA
jgi:acyl carrier protein